MRVLIDYEPFTGSDEPNNWGTRNAWPGRWLQHPDPGPTPYVIAFRCKFIASAPEVLRVHITADERYQLYLDGERVGQGPERGAPHQWFFETYDLAVTAGEHVLVARVWALGDQAPFAQLSIRPGFALASENARAQGLIGTGVAAWDVKRLDGYHHLHPSHAWGCGANLEVDGATYPWGVEQGLGDGWLTPANADSPLSAATANGYGPRQLTAPAMLPAMLYQPVRGARVRHVAKLADLPADLNLDRLQVLPADHLGADCTHWQALFDRATALTIPPHTTMRAIVDLGNYYCAYPAVTVSDGAGAIVRVHWAEALYRFAPGSHYSSIHTAGAGDDTTNKSNRDLIDNRYFIGVGDLFRPDGGARRRFETLWWQAGRYLEILVTTAAAPVTLHAIDLHETRYPLDMTAQFHASDPRLAAVIPIAWRCLQMCSHETYMDCPYYEQMMYVGDTRLEALTTYLGAGDDRLGRKALRLFDLSRMPNGLTTSRYPSRVLQVIPPFSLWWISMIHDFALWRDDMVFVKTCLPGMRSVLNYYLTCIQDDGLLQAPYGWNFVDWVPSWHAGIPPDGQYGVSGPLNWQLVLVLEQAAELETWFGENELALRYRRRGRELARRLSPAFWDKTRNLYADDLARTKFSEHTQCLALLSGTLEPSRYWKVFDGLVTDTAIERTTIYFSHYLFETFRQVNRMEHFFHRMQEWFDLSGHGFKTLPEHPGDSRSDCHAWGAHPLFHYFASVLGIRPAGPGFREVTIFPRLGSLRQASGRIQHPRGELAVDFELNDGRLTGSVVLPPGVKGTLAWQHIGIPLRSGHQRIDVELKV